MIIVITGPSGSGKTTIRRILTDEYKIPALTNVTTRSKRPGEIDGVDYLFVTVTEFDRMRAENQLVEWVEYSGNFYGLKKADNMRGITVLETEGAKKLKAMFPEDVRMVYMQVPEHIRRKRMLDRGDSPIEIDNRVQKDREKFEQSGLKGEADLIVNNIDMQETVREILLLLEGNIGN